MDKSALSKEEFDTLLQDTDPAAPMGGDDPVFSTNEPRPYDLANPSRVVRGPVPGLEQIHERFVKSLREGLSELLLKATVVNISQVSFLKFSAFMRRMSAPTSFNLVGLKPFNGMGVIALDPELVNTMVDSLFGGGGLPARIENRGFSATEQSIIQRLVQLTIRHYIDAWQPLLPLEMELFRSETDSEAVTIAAPNDTMVTATLSIELGTLKGDMHICLPYASLEAVRDVLFAPVQSERVASDPSWLGLMSRQIEEAEVEVVAHLTDVETTVRGLLNLAVGQVLECKLQPDIVVFVEDIPFLECQYGIHQGHYALRVRKFLTQVDQLEVFH